MKILQYLPSSIATTLEKYKDTVQELRLRQDKAVRIKVGQAWYFVGQNRLQNSFENAVITSADDILRLLQGACDKSIYAYEKQLLNGFLTLADGTRIGVAGSVSSEGGVVKCFSNYTSLCIRIPHFVSAYGQMLFEEINASLKSCLVIGQPASGKTTILRELACLLSKNRNVVVVDERGEITLCEKFAQKSQNVDTLLFADKQYGITTAVRALSPELIVCDELAEKDFDSIKYACNSGVAICASMHGGDMTVANTLAKQGINFDLYCILNKNHKIPPKLYRNLQNSEVL